MNDLQIGDRLAFINSPHRPVGKVVYWDHLGALIELGDGEREWWSYDELKGNVLKVHPEADILISEYLVSGKREWSTTPALVMFGRPTGRTYSIHVPESEQP